MPSRPVPRTRWRARCTSARRAPGSPPTCAPGARGARRGTRCAVVVTAPGEDQGRVVAVYENPAIRDLRVELERYPEIQEAIRTERPVIIHDVREHPLFDTIRRHWVQQAIEVNVQSAVALP